MNQQRLNSLRKHLKQRGLDAALITNEVNVSYLSGLNAQAELLITAGKKIAFVDFRYMEAAQRQLKSWQIWQRRSFYPIEEEIIQCATGLRLKRLGFEPLSLSFEGHRKLKAGIKPIKLVPASGLIETLRAKKFPQEIRLIKQAASLAVKSMDYARKIVRPGVSELEVVRKLHYYMQDMGAQGPAFDIIIASGPRSSMPHAAASARKIRNNEAVLVDLGCRISGYNSDLTRMLFLGKISAKIKHIFTIVSRAQQLAIKAARPGMKIKELDSIAREHIAQYGLGIYFGHSLGHGIGKQVHEYPSISPHSRDLLRTGMVFTIEPGIYIPKLGGFRQEDMVLLTPKGAKVLTG